ncbi:hypothetical protein C4D60_Mb04t20500 [Musa balbisiana]|uniref:Uncharacterized protein n=1 Tax=Musa balbisiana TaxID=52838 RepID=A0A4S8KDI8_MUSBA|nr:hypothetical protein C4D60_Mb04t20500 [Musa balbisiana]
MLSEPNGLPTDGDDPEAALHSRPFFPLSFPSFRLSFIPPSPSVSLETLVPPSPPHASVVFQDPLLLLPRSRQIAETPNFMAAALDPAGGALGLLVLFALISPSARVGVFSRPDKETREKFYGNLVKGESRNSSGEGSIAEIFDRVLEKEFSENDAPEGKGSVPLIKIILLAVLETVAIITHDKSKKNDTQEANSTKSFQIGDVFSLENEGSDDMIDSKDNVFVMSNRKTKYPVLQVDLRIMCLLCQTVKQSIQCFK